MVAEGRTQTYALLRYHSLGSLLPPLGAVISGVAVIQAGIVIVVVTTISNRVGTNIVLAKKAGPQMRASQALLLPSPEINPTEF